MPGRKTRPDLDIVPSYDDERRVSPRYKVVEDEAWLGYLVGEEFQTCQALILDVSLRGAMITADTVPKTEKVWLSLNGPSQTDWIEAKVVAVARTWRGPHKLRLAFETNCPYAFFKAAVYGFESTTSRPDAADEPEKQLYGNEWW